MIASALYALSLAAAPSVEAMGSVDGPFLWVDARASADDTRLAASGSSFGSTIAGQFASGVSVLGQGQLFGGWGLRVLGRRLALSAAFSGTGVVSDIYWLTFGGPRFDVSPLLLTSALVLPVDRVVLVPMIGFELPTRAFFRDDPRELQAALSFRGDALPNAGRARVVARGDLRSGLILAPPEPLFRCSRRPGGQGRESGAAGGGFDLG